MEGEIERIKILLGLHYFLHERIFRDAKEGFILKKDAIKVLWRNHNIPKVECPIIIRGMEILGLIEDNEECFKVKNPTKSREELILDFKKKMKMV